MIEPVATKTSLGRIKRKKLNFIDVKVIPTCRLTATQRQWDELAVGDGRITPVANTKEQIF